MCSVCTYLQPAFYHYSSCVSHVALSLDCDWLAGCWRCVFDVAVQTVLGVLAGFGLCSDRYFLTNVRAVVRHNTGVLIANALLLLL